MRKFLYALICSIVPFAVAAGDLTVDTSDPLFLTARGNVLSQTGLDYFETGLRLGETLSVGLADRFAIGGNLHYQQDFAGSEDGFSSFDLGGIYRIGSADENDRHIIYDAIFGLKFGGSERVRMPDYADSLYYVGLRFGRQYAGVTLAGTVKSSWIFDKNRGMAFIDFVPEVYFRINDDWRMGGNFALRKATDTHYDEESVGVQLVREYGRTQYAAHCEYAFEAEDVTAGLRVNILF